MRCSAWSLSPAGSPAGRVPPDVAGWLPGFRGRAGALIAARGWRITAATAASNLTLWLVLLACLRGLGLSQAQVPWQTSLAAFAFVRLLTVLPVTPGGLGITELGLIGTLVATAGHQASAQVTAAVLLYRAVTYLPPIPLGAIACLTWRHAPALIHSSPRNAGRRSGPAIQRDRAPAGVIEAPVSRRRPRADRDVRGQASGASPAHRRGRPAPAPPGCARLARGVPAGLSVPVDRHPGRTASVQHLHRQVMTRIIEGWDCGGAGGRGFGNRLRLHVGHREPRGSVRVTLASDLRLVRRGWPSRAPAALLENDRQPPGRPSGVWAPPWVRDTLPSYLSPFSQAGTPGSGKSRKPQTSSRRPITSHQRGALTVWGDGPRQGVSGGKAVTRLVRRLILDL